MTEKINHPKHYKGNRFEAIDIIEDYELGFNLGNSIKYVLRAGKKDNAIEDLEKAAWYLDREITRRMTEQLESTDAMTEQRYHNSIERIKAMTEEFRQAVREGDETGVF